MPGKPHDPATVERAIELVAGGMRTKFAARELGVPQRTVSEWIGLASRDGRLDAAKARHREAQGAPAGVGPLDADGEGSDAPGVTAAPAARVPRRSRLDVLYATIERQEGIASDLNLDERIRVSANDAIARALAILDKITQGDGVVAELDGMALTVEEVGACVAHVRELRERAAESPAVRDARIDAGVDAMIDDLLAGMAQLETYVDAVASLLADYSEHPRLSAVGPQWSQWVGFGVWRRVLSAIPKRVLVTELDSAEGEALAALLEDRLSGYRVRRAEAEANRKAAAEAEAERLRLARERDARFIAGAESAARKPWQ